MLAKAGYFDTSYRSAGDWQMLIRAVGFGCTFKKLDEVLGVFYLNQDGLSHSEDNIKEVDAIRKKIGVKKLYQTGKLWQSIPRDLLTGRLKSIQINKNLKFI